MRRRGDTRASRRARTAPGALAAALAVSLAGCALCSGDADRGTPPDFDGVKRGSRVRVRPASGPAWDGVAGRVTRRGGETLVCGTLDDGGAFWMVRRGERVSGMLHPTGRRAIWLPPRAGAVAEPEDPVADAAGTCGTGGRIRRWIRKGAHSPGSSTGSVGAPGEDVSRPETAEAGFDPDSDGDGLSHAPAGDETPADPQGGPQGTPDGEGVTIRVAFLLTDAAQQALLWEGQDYADDLCDCAVKFADVCMDQSQISAGFEYVGRGVFVYEPRDFDGDGTKEAESVDSVVWDIDSKNQASLDAIKTIREQLQADLVCVVTGPFAGAAGWAPVIADWPAASAASREARAWMVLRCDTLQGNTFSHEVAHVLGSTHQRGSDPDGDLLRQNCWSRGWVCQDGGSGCATMECQTIGMNGGKSLTPLPYYSAPGVQYRGVPVGEPHDPSCTVDTASGAIPADHAAHQGADSAATFRVTAQYLANVK